ncbi:tetratricopeptide repeat protein [Lacticaseibacillus paracasei]|uniref:tetratricopeptide repeat protein n=1 Tax=Lacticaseibacillus paracasei TaxID=1597 RepID=UPI0031D3E2E6
MSGFKFFSLKRNERRSTVPKSGARRKLYQYYKANQYPEIPVIPDEENAQMILDRMAMFPAVLVPRDYMYRTNGLKRGNIVFLWWISRQDKSVNKYPKYLLFEYGIDASTEMAAMEKMGFLRNDGLITDKGRKIVFENSQIIREHKSPYKSTDSYHVSYVFDDKERVLLDKSQYSEDGKLRFKSSRDVVEDQAIGRSFERNNDYANAILAYRSALDLALDDPILSNTPPPNIFTRLAIIYHKQKKYLKELDVLSEALSFYPKNVEFKNRLSKVKKLKTNSPDTDDYKS